MDGTGITRIIIWVRYDIRLKDNYAFEFALNFKGPKEILPVYCFDPRIYGATESQTKYNTRKQGNLRC